MRQHQWPNPAEAAVRFEISHTTRGMDLTYRGSYLKLLQRYLPFQLDEHAKWAGQGESLKNLKPLGALALCQIQSCCGNSVLHRRVKIHWKSTDTSRILKKKSKPVFALASNQQKPWSIVLVQYKYDTNTMNRQQSTFFQFSLGISTIYTQKVSYHNLDF